VPAGVVTVTCTVPLPAGLTAVTEVELTTVTLVAGLVPKLTAVAPVKPVPMIDTKVPPDAGPELGLRPVTVGPYVNSSAGDVGDVPLAADTVTSTVPAPAGLAAMIEVGLTTVSLAAGVAPKLTAVTPVKPVPVIVTKVPPTAGPEVGLKPVTVVGVIRSSSISSPNRKRRLVRARSARRPSFVRRNTDLITGDDMRNSQSNRGDAQPKLAPTGDCVGVLSCGIICL
jgi:hypothetical protein